MAEFIDLWYVAKTIEKLLGEDKFYVDLNSIDYVWTVHNENPELQNKSVVAMKVTRIPFAINTPKNETLNISLEIKGETKNSKQKRDLMNSIKNLLGSIKGTIQIKEDKYLYSAFFRQDKPLIPPAIENGDYCSRFYITGDMLISAAGGAIPSNWVKTYINSIEVYQIEGAVSMEKNAEFPVKINNLLPDTTVKSQSNIFGMKILFEDNEVCNSIARDIQLLENNPAAALKTYDIEKLYPSITVPKKKCVIVSGTIWELAGAYLNLEVTFKEVN